MSRVYGALCAALVGAAALAVSSFGASSTTTAIAFEKTSSKSATIWIAAANGSGARRLSSGTDPSLSPDGQLVAADGYGTNGGALILDKVAGGTITTKVHGLPLAWSPDSRYLAVDVLDSATGPSTGAGNGALDIVDATTGSVAASVPGIVSGASFKPGSGDTVVYGLAHSQLLTAPVNLYTLTLQATSSGLHVAGGGALTHDGHSLNPVWGAGGIVFDRETARKLGPAYQLFLMSGSHTTQITHMKIPSLLQGLVPLAVSSDGTKLAAEYEGEDTSEGYTVDLTTHKVTALVVGRQENSAFGISADGSRVLVSYGGFEGPSTHAVIATMPFAGGTPTVLIHGGDDPSWNQ